MMRSNISRYLIVFIVLIGLSAGVGAFWESQYNPIQRHPSRPFPSQTSTQLNRIIKEVLDTPDVVESYTLTPEEHSSFDPAFTWTSYEYSASLQDRSDLSNMIYGISEAIDASGGEVFQTYFQPDQHQTTLVIGVGTIITHTIVFHWEPPAPLPVAEVSPTPQESPAQFRAAIVIDDLGTNSSFVHDLLALGEDFTFSILPGQDKSTEIAMLLHNLDKETFLHLPMEPQSYPNTSPGRGAVLMTMSAPQIQETIEKDLQTVPFVTGMNNHMGSRLTTSREKMRTVLQHIQQHHLHFLDSRTTDATVAYTLAQELGMKSAQRRVFLDVVENVDFVKNQLEQLASLAEQGKPAIAIGHPKHVTMQGLQEMMPEFKRRNIKIVRVSEFMQ